MPIVTEAELRTQLGTPRRGARVGVPVGARLTPSADDLVRAWDLEVVAGGQAGQAGQAGREASGGPGSSEPGRGPSDAGGEDRPAWDRPGRFPVVLEGALTLVTAARARADGWDDLGDHLDTLAAYCRELLAAEYHGRPPAPVAVAGLDEDTIHHASHHPEQAVGLAHLVPDASHPEVLHWLNLLRCQVREAEVLVLDAYPPGSGEVADALSGAVNRLSSAVYVLELRTAAAAAEGGTR